MTHAMAAAFTDDVVMNDTPPPVRPWWLSYWAIAVGVMLAGELFLFVLLVLLGRSSDGGEGAAFAALLLFAVMLFWPIVWLIGASVLRLGWTIGAMLLGVRKPATPVEHTIVLPPRATRRR